MKCSVGVIAVTTWLFVFLSHNSYAQQLSTINVQGKALCTIGKALQSANWNVWNLWNTSACSVNSIKALPPPWCSWDGVGCSHGLVNNLTLGGAGLQGTLPSAIGALNASLVHLDLSSNSITGPLPSQLGQLAATVTFLSIASNGIPLSSIPTAALATLKKLQYLDIGYSGVSASLPSFLGSLTSLTYLGVAFSNVQGRCAHHS